MSAHAALPSEATLSTLSADQLRFMIWQAKWAATSREKQRAPIGNWSEWGLLAGRGFGKTLCGAQWLASDAFNDTNGHGRVVIAPTFSDVRFVCFEGPTGLLAIIPPELVVKYNADDMFIELRNVSGGVCRIRGFSAERPERLRGPQFASLWCFGAGTPVLMADGSERAIEQIVVHDVVATRFGPRAVTAAGLSGSKSARFRLSYGETNLIATGDHPMLTQRGWVAAGDLREGDVLWSVCGSAGCLGGADQTAITPTVVPAATYTARYSSRHLALYRRAATFITRTATLGITTRTTSKFCRTPNTVANMLSAASRPPSSARSCYETSSWLGRAWHRVTSSAFGAAVFFRRAAGESLALFAGRYASSDGAQMLFPASLALASSAACPTTQGQRTRNSVPNAATCSRSEIRSTDHPSPAPGAAPFLSPAATTPSSAGGCVLSPVRVDRVEKLQMQEPVYNLTVEGEHEFIAGGVIVHNCDELAAWQYAQETWDMAMMGLRLGKSPKVCWTTTPKPVELVRALVTPKSGRIVVRGSTYENKANLPDAFFQQLQQYEGTTLGRQELMAELIDPEESGIVKRSHFRLWPAVKPLPPFNWIVMSLDTAFTEATRDKKSGDPDYSACTVWGGFDIEEPGVSQPLSIDDIPELEDDKPHARRTGTTDRADNMRSYVMLLDCWQERLGLPDLITKVKRELNVAYGDDQDKALIKPVIGASKPRTSGRKVDMVIIEDKGSGISLRQTLERDNILTYAYNPGRADKLTRLHLVSPIFARRMIWLPESDKFKGKPRTWIEPLLHQLCSFTGSGSIKHDDLVDATAQALRYFVDKGMLSAIQHATRGVRAAPKPVLNPYAQ